MRKVMILTGFILVGAAAAAHALEGPATESTAPLGAKVELAPVGKGDEDNLNRALRNTPDDAKVRVAPIGSGDKSNVNKAVDWVQEKLRFGPPKRAKAVTAPTDK